MTWQVWLAAESTSEGLLQFNLSLVYFYFFMYMHAYDPITYEVIFSPQPILSIVNILLMPYFYGVNGIAWQITHQLCGYS